MDRTSHFPKKSFSWPRPADDPLNLDAIPYGASGVHVIVRRLARLLDHDLAAALEMACGISVLEWRVLSWLARNGPMSQNELIGVAVMEQSHASRVLKAMHRKGFIAMSRDTEDLRRWVCSLTDLGRAQFKSAEPVMLERKARLDSVLSDAETRDFFRCAHQVAVRAYEHLAAAQDTEMQADDNVGKQGGKGDANGM